MAFLRLMLDVILADIISSFIEGINSVQAVLTTLVMMCDGRTVCWLNVRKTGVTGRV